MLGPADFMALLHAAGAESQFTSLVWVTNHYRWIVWKLACYEHHCPQQFAGRMLTAPIVLDQLKYRYTSTKASFLRVTMHCLYNFKCHGQIKCVAVKF